MLGGATRDEQAFEATWRIELSPWCAIQPDYQYIRHAGGSADVRPVRIIGTRFDLVF